MSMLYTMMLLPTHEAGLDLQHNPHKAYAQTVEDYITMSENVEDFDGAFLSLDELRKSVETNELWVLFWYPESPAEYCFIAAATFEQLLKDADEIETRHALEKLEEVKDE